MSVHNGHRDRMRQRYKEEGLDGFREHEVLEMLLYYCIAQKDTNEMAHDLLAEFGNIPAGLSATPTELTKVPGIGAGAASYLNFIHDLNRYVQMRQKETQCSCFTSLEQCGEYLFPKFLGSRNELVYLMCLDSKCKLLNCKLLGEGSVNSAAVPIRRIVEYALNTNASTVVLAHNHPSGVALPSTDDVQTTRMVSHALKAVDVCLADHMVFSDDEYVSMRQSNYFPSDEILFGLRGVLV